MGAFATGVRTGEGVMSKKATIRRLATGVPGLDAIVGGGLPEYSFNLIVGPPGSGKTTLAHQIMFALATPERPALFFTALGEPPLKMLRYQQQFSFFDLNKIDRSIRFVNLSDDVAMGRFDQVLARIRAEVEASSPALVFVDSFRSVMLEPRHPAEGALSPQQFIQQLGVEFSGWQATTFLIGEYVPTSDAHPVFTVADGLLSLDQSVHRNSMVRKIQVLKMRGQATSPVIHTFHITSAGVEVFPAAIIRGDSGVLSPANELPHTDMRLSMGVPQLDEMLGGGLPSGYSLLVAGPSGSGKTILATAFLAEGVRRGEAGVIVAFEQTPSQSRNRSINDMARAGKIGLINTRSLDLSIDEVVHHLTRLIRQMKATRVVIDSLSGFELAVAPSFREDFRQSLFRMVAVLSGLGVTALMTSELEDRYSDLRFSPYGSAFLTDAIIVQRYIEVESCLKRVMAVVKVRASDHSTEIRQFKITDDGIVIGDPVLEYEGLLGGRPTRMPTSVTIDSAPATTAGTKAPRQ
ncbi:MAG: ATPase domain-containing protein [Rhodocyclaceae bacterium]|nr:ATPase domain-containing protein [Rhodocyclaceae bacterium]